ncbi:MAG: cysteine desulfurase family protein, partial [Pseudomonadota bacterium]
MTGLDGRRVYLDWNATAPLRPEARAAMLEAMDILGNPSSVHTEGRAARGVVEKAREQVSSLSGCDADEVAFTSGATEAAAIALSSKEAVFTSATDHDCVWLHANHSTFHATDSDGVVRLGDAFDFEILPTLMQHDVVALPTANSETGSINSLRHNVSYLRERLPGGVEIFVDAAQAAGKTTWLFCEDAPDLASVSAHKLGGPKGVGALLVRTGVNVATPMLGGGQEQGRRSGTENVVGIAGFGAAAVAAKRDLEAGVWDRVEKLRNILEEGLEAAAPDLIIFGREASRLPNTSCFAVPGWKGETQVMQLDLAGFAVSAGSACSSGKVKESRVLRAMGFDSLTASSAIRVSLGPTTTEAEIRAFLAAWTELYRKRARRAA